VLCGLADLNGVKIFELRELPSLPLGAVVMRDEILPEASEIFLEGTDRHTFTHKFLLCLFRLFFSVGLGFDHSRTRDGSFTWCLGLSTIIYFFVRFLPRVTRCQISNRNGQEEAGNVPEKDLQQGEAAALRALSSEAGVLAALVSCCSRAGECVSQNAGITQEQDAPIVLLLGHQALLKQQFGTLFQPYDLVENKGGEGG
jgi:hypothetical protein